MSWLRTAVNRAAEVGGQNQLRRTMRSYADSVVVHAGNAVAGGARILQERIGMRNLQGFKHTVKRLEEVSVSCRGVERVQLLRRWLVALKEVEKLSSATSDESPSEQHHDSPTNTFDDKDNSPKRPTLVLYVDSHGDVPRNFLDVFLYSQALEGITLSMILEAPNDEEVPLLLELYGLCLTGGKEVHIDVMRRVQDLSEAFSGCHEEVLIKREELLQFAQGAIAGLKINSDIARIDDEVCSIKEKLNNLNNKDGETTLETEPALAEIQLCFNLEALLLKKKLLRNGDSPEMHAEKVYKLKILLESLANSTSKAEKRILDHRSHKEEALSFRVAKSDEVHHIEKEMVAEIKQLEIQRDELEAELKKVNTSLAGAHMRLHNLREERDQFDEASNEILVHLKTKDDELSKSIASYREEADIVDTWIKFLDETWVLQTSYTDQKEKQVMVELEKCGDRFVSLVMHLLSIYKEMLGSLITRIKEIVESLSINQESKLSSGEDDKSQKSLNPNKDLEEQYVNIEAKFLTTSSVVETIKRQFYVQTEGIFRKEDDKVKELFDAIDTLRDKFESIDRPILKIETPNKNSVNSKSPSTKNIHDVIQSSLIREKKTVKSVENLTELDSEGNDGRSDSAEEINDWEFDAFEKD
ncbi:uncharacterized protein LOC115709144 [Cannabis sativa]|uniref:Uncharacterized protein n=1 Tax=Cannabis sativa TaxID=3483 RepID=A0A803P532_CANSA|nr:uncharacterized protein LOC115709144 [Cannabis sativa]